MNLKEIITKNHIIGWYCYILYNKYRYIKMSYGKLDVIKVSGWNGIVKYKKICSGKNNKLLLHKGCKLCNTKIHIIGNNNKIIVGENVNIGPKCSLCIEGNNCKISIGSGSTFTQIVHINVQEDNCEINIGDDCMFSNNIILRTSDSHPIYDLDTNNRLNSAKSVTVGKHVWIAPHSTIFKGSSIGDGAFIGSNTLVTKHIPENCLAVGMPAKVVKSNIKWTREDIIFHRL